MKSTLMRLAFAALLSVTGIYLSFYWYKKNAIATSNIGEPDQEPLAFLMQEKRLVETRSAQRLIWQPIKMGNPLYKGDTLRTASDAEAQIKLIKSGVNIGLEADSLIVIEEQDGDLALNLINGGLFLKQDEPEAKVPSKSKPGVKSEAKGPVIKVGNTKIAMTQDKPTELNLSIDKKGEASIMVIKGNVEVKADKKTLTLEKGAVAGISQDNKVKEEKPLEVLEPIANARIDIGAGDKLIFFKWRTRSDPGLVFIEIGAARGNLSRLQVSARLADGALKTRVPPGIFYWRLVAVKPETQEVFIKSPVFRSEAISLVPPQLLTPSGGDQVALKPEGAVISFAWAVRNPIVDTVFLLSTEENMSKVIFRKKFTDIYSFETKLKKEGKYYWRVLGYWSGDSKPLVSKMGSFTISGMERLDPPFLLSPTGGDIVGSDINPKPVALAWDHVPGAKGYVVQVRGDGAFTLKGSRAIFSKNTTETSVKLQKLGPGTYRWSAIALRDKENVSKWATPESFRITEAKPIVWQGAKDEKLEIRELPDKTKVSWTHSGEPVRAWRIRSHNVISELATGKWQTTTDSSFELSLSKPGDYYLEVEGLNAHGDLVARSKVKKMSVTLNLELPPPVVIGATNNKIVTKADGSVRLTWQDIPKAKDYEVRLVNKEKDVKIQRRTTTSSISFASLKPGTYALYLATRNNDSKVGPMSKPYTVSVPDLSDISAPIKVNIEIK